MSSVAFHFNGNSMRRYPEDEMSRIYAVLDANSNSTHNPGNECDIYTFDNHPRPVFIECCRKLGLDYINLGEDQYFNPIREKYPMNELPRKHLLHRSWKDFCPVMKTLTLYNYLKSNPSKKYFFFFDQSDVLLVDNPEKKLEIFKGRNCNLLYNAESKCMYFAMRIRYSKHYSDTNKYFANYGDVKRFCLKTYGEDCFKDNGAKLCFLNTGGFVCERDFYIDLVEKYFNFIVEFMSTNEQTIFHHLHFMYYPQIQVDHKCEIFQCMGPKKIKINV